MSASNAQLAGVLAGFMILALTTLLTIKRDSSSHFQFGVKHATVLLGVGIITLGANAYLFGSISATKPLEINGSWPAAHSVCRMAWIEFMPAAAMLGLGAMVLVAGLTWMIVCHGSEPSEVYGLAKVSNWAITFVAIGAQVFITYDALMFIDEMHDFKVVAAEWEGPTRVAAGVYLLIFVVYCLSNPIRTNKKLDQYGKRNQATPAQADLAATAPTYDPDGCVRDKVRLATAGVSCYLLLAFAFTLVAGWGSGAYRYVWFGYILYFVAIVLWVIGPGVILWLITRASPGMNEHGLSPTNGTRLPSPTGNGDKSSRLAILGFIAGCVVGLHLGG